MKKSSTPVSPVMRKLSTYIAQAPRRPLPAAVTERAKYHLLDTINSAARGIRPTVSAGRSARLQRPARWPVGYPIQAPLDAVSNVMAARGVTAKDVERVLITLDEHGARTVSGRLMADINIQHLAALMLLDGDITFASSHDQKRVRDPAVLKLGKRIEIGGSAALAKTKTTQAIVEITTRSGERLRHHTRAVRGSATNPMSRDDVAAKARGLLTHDKFVMRPVPATHRQTLHENFLSKK